MSCKRFHCVLYSACHYMAFLFKLWYSACIVPCVSFTNASSAAASQWNVTSRWAGSECALDLFWRCFFFIKQFQCHFFHEYVKAYGALVYIWWIYAAMVELDVIFLRDYRSYNYINHLMHCCGELMKRTRSLFVDICTYIIDRYYY